MPSNERVLLRILLYTVVCIAYTYLVVVYKNQVLVRSSTLCQRTTTTYLPFTRGSGSAVSHGRAWIPSCARCLNGSRRSYDMSSPSSSWQ